MTATRLSGRRLAVPASTSNLGPGFDALGLAFQCFLTIEILDVDVTAERHGLVCRFAGGPPVGDNLIEVGYRAYGSAAGVQMPAVSIAVDSSIPIRAGLGSSAAAIVAGLRLASLVQYDPRLSLLEIATRLEGHPDNVSAALNGGWTTSVVEESGAVVSRSRAWPERFRTVVATPDHRLATRIARGVLPTHVSLADAVFNLQRVGLLVDAVTHADPEAMRSALGDRLHQPARCAIIPGLEAALRLEHPQLIGVFLSGAGPSVVAICDGETPAVEALLRATYARQGIAASVAPMPVQQPFEHHVAVAAQS